jgi:hypothetical protein
MVGMEVEASWIGGGGCSREVSKHNSTQGQMDEKVQRTSARLGNVGVEKEGAQKKECLT